MSYGGWSRSMRHKKGSATLEYVIILPLTFVCVLAVILVFLALYQKAAVQALAESTAEGLSQVWGHKPLKPEEIATGSYKKSSYDTKEVYWQIKPWGIKQKQEIAEAWVFDKLNGLGLLRGQNGAEPSVRVQYVHGFPYSKVRVSIEARYQVPGGGLFSLIGMEDFLTIKGYAEATVFDPKEMINNSDYVIQFVKNSKAGEIMEKVFGPLKKGMDNFLGSD